MSTAPGPASGLPVRTPRQQPGRHRRPEALTAPEGAPVLVLAVPGAPTAAALSLAEEVVSIARSELSGLDPRIAFVDGEDVDQDEFPGLRGVLDQVAAERPGEDTSAVVVPLLAGPEASVLRRIRQAIADSKAQVELTDVLGPHPLLAEAVHVRLAEAGLARADRARLFTVATAADGIILATVGGEEAAQAAGVTGLLLAARLAVPVLAAALDEDGAIAHAAEELRSSGSATLALAPYLIGPEIAPQLLHTAAAEAGCSGADALGPYPAVGKLVVTQYAAAVGIVREETSRAQAQ
ncbi:sirohydrochlorin chelatase [Streptomyces sp. NBC_01190]|uniref:sirohydrochlorin chelatase n=1 Tax=Streptomyces sp. NBC_01190 TaxID=2903767 RepID=UPI00386564A5|nr:CbiX/SirB N-terminal domain-containing protein [Streptomyces sp. NBC_01190]